VYLLGSRTFCTYVCPYGAVFALADRVAAGRIRLTGECQQCGSCTAACTSAVRVHEEIGRFGMVVNPACLKDLDCVGACPHEVLGYGFGRPAMLKSDRGGGRFGLSYGFSMGEELMMAGVFMVCLLTFRGLYGRVPFLLSLAVGAIIAYGSVVTLRVLRRPSVRMGRRDLKRYGRLATGGYVYLAAATLVFVFVGHSAVVRYYEYTGLRQSLALQRVSDENQRLARAGVAHDRLLAADRWGLLANPHVARGLVITSSQLDRPEETVVFANRYLERVPGDSWVGLKLGQALLALDRPAEAERRFVAIVSSFQDNLVAAPRHVATAYQSLAQVMFGRGDSSAAVVELRRALAIAPEDAALHAELGSMLAEAGDFDGAIEQLREAIRREPELGKARYNLGTLLAHTGRTAEAVIEYRAALDHLPDDADLHNNLGFALMRVGETEAARREFVAVLGLNPDHAGAHFNLARLLFAAGDVAEAERHLQTAARLDPRFGG
ncbi:MAG: tetratricopeptide repeat protein, partial [Phycisphaerae bacterium]